MELIKSMLTERTAHSIIDSGDHYGRSYLRNREKDFDKEPQAVLTDWGPSVSFYHHALACLEEDALTRAFNAIPCENWDGEYYGTSTEQCDFLELIGAEVGPAWNSYNWDNNFDQTVQGHKVEINQAEYVLLQVHGGCDVRSGYTDAKLFKIQEWMNDYWMLDDCNFAIDRDVAEACGYPKVEGEIGYNYIVVDYRGGSEPEVYDPRLGDQGPEGLDLDKLPEGFRVEGVQLAVEH